MTIPKVKLKEGEEEDNDDNTKKLPTQNGERKYKMGKKSNTLDTFQRQMKSER